MVYPAYTPPMVYPAYTPPMVHRAIHHPRVHRAIHHPRRTPLYIHHPRRTPCIYTIQGIPPGYERFTTQGIPPGYERFTYKEGLPASLERGETSAPRASSSPRKERETSAQRAPFLPKIVKDRVIPRGFLLPLVIPVSLLGLFLCSPAFCTGFKARFRAVSPFRTLMLLTVDSRLSVTFCSLSARFCQLLPLHGDYIGVESGNNSPEQ